MSYTLWAAKVGIIPPLKKPKASPVDHRLWPVSLLESVNIDALDSLIREEDESYLDEAFLWRFSYQGENYWDAIYTEDEPLQETDFLYLQDLALAYHQWHSYRSMEAASQTRTRQDRPSMVTTLRATEYVPF